MRSFNQRNDDFYLERITRIVIVRGWSSGPLRHLKRDLSAHQGCHELIEPSNLNLFMPPFPGLWCCHPAVISMIFVLGAIIHFTVNANIAFLLRLPIALLAFVWFRVLVGVAVRTSIETSIQRISREGLNSETDHNPVLIIGFSWGGSVVAEMIARGMVGGANQQSSVLLIAPTTSLVARVAIWEDAASRIAKLDLSHNRKKITVVHGEYDVAFCPHQNRWSDSSGIDLQILPDNHVFMTSSSLGALKRILIHYLQQ